jgi:hypothetical protein
MPTFNIYFLLNGESHMTTATGPTRAGRRVTLLLMEGAEITGVINSEDD